MNSLYPDSLRFRDDVAARFPKVPLIQLPISFPAMSAPDVDGVFFRHPDLTILVRDTASAARIRAVWRGQVSLCPDSAFGLDAIERGPVEQAVAVLQRIDEEGLGAGRARQHDWLGFGVTESVAHQMLRLARPVSRRGPAGMGRRFAETLHQVGLQARIARGVTHVSAGQILVTDRLHGHLLACLLGIPNVVVPDRLGKIREMIASWSGDFGLTQIARDWEHGYELARRWVDDAE